MPPCSNCEGTVEDREWHGNLSPRCTRCGAWWSLDALKLTRGHRRAPPPDTEVSLTFEPNGTSHNDLVLRVGSFAHRCDSYYFELDRPAKDVSDPVYALTSMLEKWITTVSEARAGQPFYVPYDFSDQGTAWLRGEIEDDDVTLVPGWTAIEGWSFYPSHFVEIGRSLTGFDPVPDVAPHRMKREKLLRDIAESLRAARPPS